MPRHRYRVPRKLLEGLDFAAAEIHAMTQGNADPCHKCGTLDTPGYIHAECRACRHVFCYKDCVHDHSCGNYRTISEDEYAMLTAIISKPADDAPRLIYADFLNDLGTERDDDRAVYIRLNVLNLPTPELGKLIPRGGLKQPQPYDQDTARTWQQLWWAKLIPETPTDVPIAHPYTSWVHWRGMIEYVECTLEDWLTHGPSLIRRHPIQSVRIINRQPFGGRVTLGSFDRRGASRCAWFTQGMNGVSFIPMPISDFFEGSGGGLRGGHFAYSSYDAAYAGLSNACLKWARSYNDAVLSEIKKSSKERRKELLDAVDPTPRSAQSLLKRLQESGL